MLSTSGLTTLPKWRHETCLCQSFTICRKQLGNTPETHLAKQAGLDLDNGIAVNAFGKTSDPSIWAVGDCASYPTPEGRQRLECVSNAIDMAELVAGNIMGPEKNTHPLRGFGQSNMTLLCRSLVVTVAIPMLWRDAKGMPDRFGTT